MRSSILSAEPRRKMLDPGNVAGRLNMAYELFPERASTNPAAHDIVPYLSRGITIGLGTSSRGFG
ncbi:hypothetical protein [Bradyrhizobium sp. BR 10261]|uniref:hypothetical protein n=1 Tax=Bradyrhizobium sp. BR 10261 TaxID=2749992 RepID=UPI001C653475|nr:hypothetical protein [Bradyrhizobium sp. BR 10261]MBW7961648.1 hypothetical protein [Bradyrhizobium sp. BR 10261]